LKYQSWYEDTLFSLQNLVTEERFSAELTFMTLAQFVYESV